MNTVNSVYNLNSPMVDFRTGILIPPWNTFFQQFVQAAQPFSDILENTLNLGFQPNTVGNVYIIGTPMAMTLQRGKDSIPLDLSVKFIPMSIGDKLFATNVSGKFIPQR